MTGQHREFKREAVRLSLERGKTIPQLAEGLGIGKTTLYTWRGQFRDKAALSGSPEKDPEKELARLRRENEILRQKRDLFKKATSFFARETKR